MFPYTIKKSTRAKRLQISIGPDATVILTVPVRVSMTYAKIFIRSKQSWVEKHLQTIQKRSVAIPILPKRDGREYNQYKEEARALVEEKLATWSTFYTVTWNRVSIKNTSSRWGSCSKKKNLNFSYRILFLPAELADYLIVHELCHLIEMNHGPQFWREVEKTIPNYKLLRQQLRHIT